MLILSLASVALAADPEVSTSSDGTVVAQVVVAAAPETVRQLLDDPKAAASLCTNVRSVTTAPKGNCLQVKAETDGPWTTLHYESLRCPTADGWHETLVKSDDFTKMDVRWELVPVPEGTRVEYTVRTELNSSLPTSLVNKGVEKSARSTLERLVEKLKGR